MFDGTLSGGSSGAAEAARRAAEAARRAAEQAAREQAAEQARVRAAQAAREQAAAARADSVSTAPNTSPFATTSVPPASPTKSDAPTFRVNEGGLVGTNPPSPPVRDDWYRDPQFNQPAAPPSTGVQAVTDRNDARLLAQEMGGSAGDQSAFVQTYVALDDAGRGQLEGLLPGGQLLDQDSQGTTLIQNLATMSDMDVPADAPYTAQDILSQTISHVSDPDTINQSIKNTCGAATVQYVLAKDDPAEYARVVAGLTGVSGQVQLQSGVVTDRVPDSLGRCDGTWMPEKPGQGRDDVERIVQAAFQDHGFDPRGVYSNVTDKFSIPVGDLMNPNPMAGPSPSAGGEVYNAALEAAGANQGIGEDKVAQLYRDVLGRDAHVVGDWGSFLAPLRYRDGQDAPMTPMEVVTASGAELLAEAAEPALEQNVLQQVEDAVRAGHQVPVDLVIYDPGQTLPDGSNPTWLAGDGSARPEVLIDQSQMGYGDLMRSHQVLVTAMDDTTVHYRNPWGFEATMTRAEFESRLTDAVIPE
jgi:hypothetical protein